MWRRGKLSNRILASVIAILAASTLVGFGLDAAHERAQLQRDAQERALAVAQTFAAMPSIREGLYRRDAADRRLIQSLAQEVRRKTGASYIVVLDRAGVRFSHPDPRLIGKRVSEPVVALDGRDHLDVDHGNLGVSANAKVPLRSPKGTIIGEVSAGIPEARVWSQLVAGLPRLGLYFLSALAIGSIASILLTRRLKRVTFGLELEEIAALVHEREAMLHNIREGVITVDGAGRVSLINDEARRLLSLGDGALHASLEQLLAPSRLRDLLTGAVTGRDQIVLTDEQLRTDPPDLVLLDLFLPDGNGLDLLREPWPEPELRPDFLVLTAARDMRSVRTAMRLGAVHYLVKPFDFRQVEERLRAYSAMRRGLARIGDAEREAEQHEVDALYGLLRGPVGSPKGQSAVTLSLIRDLMRSEPRDLSAGEIAQRIGISRSTAQRYLVELARQGELELRPHYGATGRPEHRYRTLRT